jgi:hypothetical protein
MTDTPLPPLPKLEALTQLRKPLRSVNIEHKQKLSGLDRLAIQITDRVGTMGFFLIIFAWTIVRLGWNALARRSCGSIPFPRSSCGSSCQM